MFFEVDNSNWLWSVHPLNVMYFLFQIAASSVTKVLNQNVTIITGNWIRPFSLLHLVGALIINLPLEHDLSHTHRIWVVLLERLLGWLTIAETGSLWHIQNTETLPGNIAAVFITAFPSI